MPLTVINIATADALNNEQSTQIEVLYTHSPEFADGKEALTQLKTAMGRGDQFYGAMFNDKIIAGIWCRGAGESKTLQYIVTHPANRGRGIAEYLVGETCKQETSKGVNSFVPGCGAVHRILSHLEYI
jgi:GNAT superfamily N-acetyltransferase